MLYLFARKLDIDRAVKLLTNNLVCAREKGGGRLGGSTRREIRTDLRRQGGKRGVVQTDRDGESGEEVREEMYLFSMYRHLENCMEFQ